MDGRLSLRLAHGYETRKQVLDELMKSGTVFLDGSRLNLGILTESFWLSEGLEQGSTEAWEIVDAFPRKARKFNPDNEKFKEIGMRGELFVIDELKRILPENYHDRIRHVSLTDDTAGFDITTPSTINPNDQLFLEVKTSTRPGEQFNFHLSRNEFETAKTSKNWYLILVSMRNTENNIFGYLEGASLAGYFPEDTTKGFSWTSATGTLSKDDLRSLWP